MFSPCINYLSPGFNVLCNCSNRAVYTFIMGDCLGWWCIYLYTYGSQQVSSGCLTFSWHYDASALTPTWGWRRPALAGPIDQFGVISAGETGESCREFPGARPACRGTPETPVDSIGREPKWLSYIDVGVRFGRKPELCARKGRLGFGREPNCVRGRRLFTGR